MHVHVHWHVESQHQRDQLQHHRNYDPITRPPCEPGPRLHRRDPGRTALPEPPPARGGINVR
jgi:hypothetical protein